MKTKTFLAHLVVLLGVFAAGPGQAMVCAEDTIGAEIAKVLAAAVIEPLKPEFDPKFCEALVGCEKFSKITQKEKNLATQETYFLSLESTVQVTKSLIEEQAKSLQAAMSADPIDYIKIKDATALLKGSKNSLTSYEADLKDYQEYLENPKSLPHPKHKKIGADGGEFVYGENESYYQKRTAYFYDYFQDLPGTIKLQENVIAQLLSKTGVDNYEIQNAQYLFKRLTEDFKLLEAYTKDPVNVLHPVKQKGYGFSLEERRAKKRLANEARYKENKLSIPVYESQIASLKVQIEKIKADKKNKPKKESEASEEDEDDDDLGYKEQILKSNEKQLEKSQALELKYQNYLKNPSAQPEFLDKYSYYIDVDDSENPVGCDYAKSLYEGALSINKSYKAGTCGMKPEELAMVKYYSDSGFVCVNSYLRQTKTKLEDLDLLVSALNRGLSKLPNYEGIVKRGATLPLSIRDKHKVGSIVPYDSYTSTSTYGGFGGEDIFYIYSKTGKPIMGFSSHSGEKEVLFKSGGKFKVLDVKKVNNRNYYVLKDVSQGSGSDDSETDKKILELVQEGKKNSAESSSEADIYYCPLGESPPESKVMLQKFKPIMDLPAETKP